MLLFAVSLNQCFAAPAKGKIKPAKLKVSGYGIFGNYQLKRILKTLELSGKRPQYFGPAFIEDSALILGSRIKKDGYLKPEIKIRLQLADGGQMETTANELLEKPLPRSLLAMRAEFKIRKGVLYHYQQLDFEGLKTITPKEAKSYFMETAILLHPKSARVYTPERLKQGLTSLTDILERDGYEQAQAVANQVSQDAKTGRVRVKIHVNQGPRFLVESVEKHFIYEGESPPASTTNKSSDGGSPLSPTNAPSSGSEPKRGPSGPKFDRIAEAHPSANPTNTTVHPHKPHSKVWAQDFSQELKTNLFHRGYPDASVELKTLQKHQDGDVIRLDLEANVKSGPRVKIGVVDFAGEKRTKEKTMAKRVRVKRGELLDRIKVEDGRYRLAQLGSFDTVDLIYQPVDEHTRDVLYRVKEGKNLEVSLLAGYGSYELLRGGFEIEKNNIWGLGHHARLKAVQSFKASSGEFVYTVPDFVSDVDLFFNASGLRREEVSFTRIEYGGGFGGHRYFKDYATDLTIRYSYQILNASEVAGVVTAEGITNTSVGAIITDIKHDRRDNPLYPRKGYKVFANLELASEYLAGDVNYQRLEISTAWHRPLGGGRYLGLGLSHGVILSIGSAAEDLPFNRRFFPGGENSIRGYGEGEASPRDAEGKIVGAETFTLGIVEFEQALTPKWSLVLFSDSLGFAQRADNYPFDTGLFSVGAGLRWKTIVGPMRLEYGHNLNPRAGDPSGTLHFSLGFPF
jgi:outer membrane protein assembly factor BamA